MTERPFIDFQDRTEIPYNPQEFVAIVEESAKKLGLKIFEIEFNREVSRTEDPDGTQHITVKPVLLTEVPNLGSRDSIYVLRDGSLTYAVNIHSWGGELSDGGNQTLYTNIALFRWEQELKVLGHYFNNRLGSEYPALYYHCRQNWVAGEEIDRIESEKSSVGILKIDEEDPLFKEILSRVTPTT